MPTFVGLDCGYEDQYQHEECQYLTVPHFVLVIAVQRAHSAVGSPGENFCANASATLIAANMICNTNTPPGERKIMWCSAAPSTRLHLCLALSDERYLMIRIGPDRRRKGRTLEMRRLRTRNGSHHFLLTHAVKRSRVSGTICQMPVQKAHTIGQIDIMVAKDSGISTLAEKITW
jgi:uncharacterized protein with PhoU and TrkA domain